ncbi:MAG TPA: glycoside hydrolase family 20 zincin-like fold domain-containing protein, partial [Gemmatimonadales bacterium]|nr:glycoside hydrolase family 20 zincin-like fold domain-containing protein [Gemmatimonadales bacterium]
MHIVAVLVTLQAPLIPQPREYAALADIPLRGGVAISPGATPEDRFTVQTLSDGLRARGVRVVAAGTVGAVPIVLARTATVAARQLLAARHLVFDSTMHDEGYVLVAAGGGRVTIVAATGAGLFYGAQTLLQLVAGEGGRGRIRGAVIRDWPAMRYRGFQDDLSRGPVPTLDYQKRQIRIAASLKLNVFSPYFEHTLAYDANPLIAPPGGAMSHADVRELVAYAARYHVTVVPEQEAFGHLHHILKLETYAGLGETAHGHVLAPSDSGALPLIASWFAEIDSLFPGPFVHIGADETFELGRGRTRKAVDSTGIGPVYLAFLARIEQALAPSHKRLLFWGDVAVSSPELVKSLPHDLIPVAWNYWSKDGFDALLTPFQAAGLETWVAPGTNGWNRVFPDYSIALPNIQGFVATGQRLGSTGVLNTTWDDDGEDLFEGNWYGIAFGAAASWQPGTADIPAFQSSFGAVFCGDTTGAIDDAERKLAQAHALLDSVGVGGGTDLLFWMDPWSPRGRMAAAKIRPVLHDVRLLTEQATALILRVRPSVQRNPETLDAIELGARRIGFLAQKFQTADEIVLLYAQAQHADSP